MISLHIMLLGNTTGACVDKQGPPFAFEEGSYDGSYGEVIPLCLLDCPDVEDGGEYCELYSAWLTDSCSADCSEVDIALLVGQVAEVCNGDDSAESSYIRPHRYHLLRLSSPTLLYPPLLLYALLLYGTDHCY